MIAPASISAAAAASSTAPCLWVLVAATASTVPTSVSASSVAEGTAAPAAVRAPDTTARGALRAWTVSDALPLLFAVTAVAVVALQRGQRSPGDRAPLLLGPPLWRRVAARGGLRRGTLSALWLPPRCFFRTVRAGHGSSGAGCASGTLGAGHGIAGRTRTRAATLVSLLRRPRRRSVALGADLVACLPKIPGHLGHAIAASELGPVPHTRPSPHGLAGAPGVAAPLDPGPVPDAHPSPDGLIGAPLVAAAFEQLL